MGCWCMLRSIRAMGRCRRVWMIFSLYYGVDLTRGFMSVALVLLDASVQVTPHSHTARRVRSFLNALTVDAPDAAE